MGPEVTALHATIAVPPGRPRQFRGLTWLLLSRTTRDEEPGE